MEVFRLSRKKFAAELSGLGASLKGARWNSKGTEIIYTSSNRSLAMAEIAVHFSLATLPDDYQMLTISIPDKTSIKIIDEKSLQVGWNIFPYPSFTQKFGDEFIKSGLFCLLKVPSAVTKGDYNILINPFHKEFSRIKVVQAEDFPFDKRIFR